MPDDVAIKVSHVSKDFRFSSHRSNTLKSLFTGITHKKDRDEKIQHALKDIDFEIKKGEFFGIVGRNGSGKSTLLKIMAGIYQPNKGKVQVAGKLVPFIELGVGFNPDLTGKENVYMNGALLGFNTKEIDTFYNEVVEFAELEKFMDKKLKNYSSGMQVRLAFSMAIRAKADVLLIDEVLAVGDADFQRKCFGYFENLKSKETTVVFVSHDMNAVRKYCDRAALINNSRLIKLGDTEDIAQSYSKLFAVSKSSSIGTDNRWGDRLVEVKKVSADINSKVLKIRLEYKSHTEGSSPVIGVRIRKLSGEIIAGTNSTIENFATKSLSANRLYKLTLNTENIFSDGVHIVDVAIQHNDGVGVYDWWDGAATFEVVRGRQSPYIVDPNFVISDN